MAPHQHKKVLIDYEDIPDIGEICAHAMFVLLELGGSTSAEADGRLQKIF